MSTEQPSASAGVTMPEPIDWIGLRTRMEKHETLTGVGEPFHYIPGDHVAGIQPAGENRVDYVPEKRLGSTEGLWPLSLVTMSLRSGCG